MDKLVVASKVMKPVVKMVGAQNRLMVRVPGGKAMVGAMNRALGKLLPRLSFLGFRKDPSYENALHNWETYLVLVGAGDYEKETRGPRENVYTFHKCPAGFCRSAHADACDATMVLDHSVVESSGARLRVDKTIPVDGVCVEVVVPAGGSV
ncbi:MAG: hypothetical protein PHP28_03855 [Actinomycetota bacterium]|nr:hypothetical protein [Actinomycetota bacterium]